MKSAKSTVTVGYFWFILLALPFLLGVKSCGMGVQCGDVLDRDFGFYKLAGDLECPNNPEGAAVTITGERVRLNLAGHTITRDDDTGGLLTRGIAVQGANAHIRGGSVVDITCPDRPFNEYCAGIRLHEAPGTKINGMSLNNNTNGIVMWGDADGARINGNDITGNLHYGIGFFGSAEGARIVGNNLSDTDGWPGVGVSFGYIGSSDDVSLIGNVASNCGDVGILLIGNEDNQPAQRNMIRDNTTLDNGGAGIGTFGSTEALRPRDNLIQSNTSFGNQNSDLTENVAGSSVPPPVAPDCLNTWKDNDFDVATPDCIE
jgi:parallel beta-helix repeat protein